MEEEQIHRDAFELYFTLRQNGQNKTNAVTRVAQEYNRSKSRIWEWKKEFNWDEKETLRSLEIEKEVEKKTNARIIDNKAKYLSYYHRLLKELKKADFPIEIKNVSDLKAVIEGALVLQDQPIEHIKKEIKSKVDIEHEIPAEVIKAFGDFAAYRETNRTSKTDSSKDDSKI